MTPYHAKYFSQELTRKRAASSADRLSMSLFDASVDLNPHQIDAALFALSSPIAKGAILADEVGLGKTIEAGLVLCQNWADKKRRLLVVCPASLRKQWSLELEEKFNLPTTIIDSQGYKGYQEQGFPNPFEQQGIVITSINFASAMQGEIRAVAWDLIVIDEAHKLRNVYRPSNKMGQRLKWALEDRRKLLLTATPLQNSLLELFGLASIIDDKIFGDYDVFRSSYMRNGSDINELRSRLSAFIKRTLRKEVTEYVSYTQRKTLTKPFNPTDDEHKFYETLSNFLRKDDTFSIPKRQRQLTTLILRKLLASSSHAIAGTLDTMIKRLENIKDGIKDEDTIINDLIFYEELEDEYLDEEVLDETDTNDEKTQTIDKEKLNSEIAELTHYANWARTFGVDTKSRSLINALEIGFSKLVEMGANRKAVIFTESRRTQEYLKNFLEANGYTGKIVIFNGTNTSVESKAIYERWLSENTVNGRSSGSKTIDIRTALIEHFQDNAEIMIATEAASEGVNLQFCSLVINYDLPWNPQRIEQRIGRCHRYGQKYDVVVINFLNERNHADVRVLELLTEKFNLFNGVFGSSDEVLGTIESGVDFEKRVLAIYQECRTEMEIGAAFKKLQAEMDEIISARLDDTRKNLLEHFDEDVHSRLKLQLDATKEQLDIVGKMFWTLTKFILNENAQFDDSVFSFNLLKPPTDDYHEGIYHLISKNKQNIPSKFLYRLSHPLGEFVLDNGKKSETPIASITFDISNHPTRILAVEHVKGKSGWLVLQKMVIESFETEEYLLFSGFDDSGSSLDQETAEKMFRLNGKVDTQIEINSDISDRLEKEADRHAKATISRSLESNNKFFQVERERLEKWAEDLVSAADKELQDVKAQIRGLTRQARLAPTMEEQHSITTKIQELEREKRRKRQSIFDIEDEIYVKRDALIEKLERRLSQKTSREKLYCLRWSVM